MLLGVVMEWSGQYFTVLLPIGKSLAENPARGFFLHLDREFTTVGGGKISPAHCINYRKSSLRRFQPFRLFCYLERAFMSRKIFTFKNKRHVPVWLAGLLAGLIKVISFSYRLRLDDPHGWLQKQSPWPIIVPIWHNRILFLPALAPHGFLDHMVVLISASRDGGYVASFVHFFKLRAVRGSSSRGGREAFLALSRQLREGFSPILTVDGPRGPRYQVHHGVVALAMHSGAPILPVALNAPRRWELKNWDRTQIPWPFSRVTLRLGELLYVAPDEARDTAAERVRQALLRISDD